MEKETRLVTRLELVESQHKLKNEVNKKIENIDDKVDDLRDIVLPLAESSKQTAENTKKIADTIDDFTKEQYKTNGRLWSKINNHEVSLTEIGVTSKAKSDVWSSNAKIIVSVISIIGILITGIFSLAPLFFK